MNRTPPARRFSLWVAALTFGQFLLAVNSAKASEGFQLKADSRDIPAHSQILMENFLIRAESLLPARLKQNLNRKVTVRFAPLDRSTSFQVPACVGDQPNPDAQKQTLGKISKSWLGRASEITELTLNQNLISIILAGEASAQTYSCGHKNAYRLALATVVHELGHIYDYADPKTAAERAFLRRCEGAATHGKGAQSAMSPECRDLKYRLTVSNRAGFLDLMGWVETGLIFQTRGQANASALRSPDPYEFKNSKESFAVNLEYFAMDPEFACRRPAVHAFYSKHFGADPFSNRTCRAQSTITLTTGEVGSGRALTADINPERVYEVHALFAGKGPQMMSRWGHSLYRVVVCAPERAVPGPECLNDVAYHVALSFRASVSDAAISYWKGITGKYPSLLFAQPFLGVIEEYNKGEFRELVSLPLKLTQDEKSFFIYRTLEAFWEYGGRYKFITNNCATEALNFLKGTLGETRISSKHPRSPLGLHEVLQKAGIVDTSVIWDRHSAVEKGYYYASKKPEIERAFAGLVASCGARCELALPKKVDLYLSQTTAAQRREWYSVLLERSTETRQVMAARFFLLESYVQRWAGRAYVQQLARVLEAGNFEGLSREAIESAVEIKDALARIRELQLMTLPASLKTDGYGIPIVNSESGTSDPDTTVPADILQEQKELTVKVMAWAKVAFAAWISEIEAIQKNRLYFLKEMRKSG